MQHICEICDKPINDFDRVRVLIEATYHPLKSKITYAIGKEDLEVVGPISHRSCYGQD